MKYKSPAVPGNFKPSAVLRIFKSSALFGVSLILALPASAQRGGGHGGGFGGGHSAGSGHSVGHSIGHAVGHVFGLHAGGHGNGMGRTKLEAPPLAGAAMVDGHIEQLPGSGLRAVRPIPPRRPLTTFGFRSQRGFFGFGFAGLGFCSPFDGFFTGYTFDSGFDCLPGDFFFDPYAGSGYAPDFGGMQWLASGTDRVSEDLAAAEDFHPDVILEEETPPLVDKVPHHRHSAHEPDTILQLKDGSMYGLRDYWVEDQRLCYVTNYGGQNSVPLSQIDFAKSGQLNADRGEKLNVPDRAGTN